MLSVFFVALTCERHRRSQAIVFRKANVFPSTPYQAATAAAGVGQYRGPAVARSSWLPGNVGSARSGAA
jgi:hypothetical protein